MNGVTGRMNGVAYRAGFILVIVAVLLLACWARAQTALYQVVVTWDANAEPDLAGYRLFWGTGGSNGWTRDCGLARTQTVSLPSRGPWMFFVKAYNVQGLESLPSTNLVIGFPGTVGALRPVVGSVTLTTNWVVMP